MAYISYCNTEAHYTSCLGIEGLRKSTFNFSKLIFQSYVVYHTMVYFSVVKCRMLFIFVAVRTDTSSSVMSVTHIAADKSRPTIQVIQMTRWHHVRTTQVSTPKGISLVQFLIKATVLCKDRNVTPIKSKVKHLLFKLVKESYYNS